MNKIIILFLMVISMQLIGCSNSKAGTEENSKAEAAGNIETAIEQVDDNASKTDIIDESDKSHIDDAVRAYADILEDIEVTIPSEASYGLIFVDGDDIPELYYIDNSAHPCGAVIYNYAGDKVNRLVHIGSNGEFLYIEHKNLLIHKWSGQGVDIFEYYTIKNDFAECLGSYEYPLGSMDPAMFSYMINDEVVTEAEFREDYAKFIKELPNGRAGVSCINIDDSFLLKNFDKTDFTEDYKKYIVKTKGDPLSGINYLTTNFSTIGKRETINLEESFMAQTNTSPEDILMFTYMGDDAGAFVFVGSTLNDDMGPAYKGKLWYIDAISRNAKIIFESENGYSKIDGDLYADYYYLTEWYTTGGISYIFDIRDGRPVEVSDFSGIGQIQDTHSFTPYIKVEVSSYDNFSDTDGNLLGHTWKPYYWGINRDGDTYELFEYEGHVISEKELIELCEFDIISEIKGADYLVKEIYSRDNGIVSINVEKLLADGTIEFNNVNYDINNHCYILADNESEERTMMNSMFGGQYKSRATKNGF